MATRKVSEYDVDWVDANGVIRTRREVVIEKRDPGFFGLGGRETTERHLLPEEFVGPVEVGRGSLGRTAIEDRCGNRIELLDGWEDQRRASSVPLIKETRGGCWPCANGVSHTHLSDGTVNYL